MIWDWLVQRTGKYCFIRRIEYPELQTVIFGRMESAHNIYIDRTLVFSNACRVPSQITAAIRLLGNLKNVNGNGNDNTTNQCLDWLNEEK